MIKEAQKGKGITLRDIARRAGVNRSTVSRVLNNATDFPVSEKSREKIIAIAEELQYQPKLSAKSLASGKSFNINLLLASISRDITSPALATLIDVISRELRKNNYNLIITPVSVSDRATMTREVQAILGSCTVDGSIIGGGLLDKKLRDQFSANRIPAVLMDIHCKEEDFGCFPFIHHLAYDENPGQEQLLRHLIELGHKKIAYITSGPCADIMQAFGRAVAKYNVDFTDNDIFYFYDWQHESVSIFERQMYYYRKMAEEWKRLRKYSAIVCTDSTGALGVVEFLKDKGLAVGKDVSVTGYGKYREFGGELTAIDKAFDETGKKAVEILLNAIKTPEIQPVHVKIPTQLFIGNTTGKLQEKKNV
ncbi:MAG: hypothetical protein A2017_16520 [Lentisphaerae bacterium GWF2_44_16]|nr:MAG: hypothetical protein A2017_16520 [Lentisphaerae bacterium GWF2_44_16]